MSNVTPNGASARKTSEALDVTGRENLMLLLPDPGAELDFGPFIAELCARGRPPFVVVLADGAHDGSNDLANLLERRSREALSTLGVPDDRVLFVGLRTGSLPTAGAALFDALVSAMALLNWRKDCNVVGTVTLDGNDGDRLATCQVAEAVAERLGLRLIVGAVDAVHHIVEPTWEFDGTAWLTIAARASETHRDDVEAGEGRVGRFQSLLIGGSTPFNLA